MLGEKPCTRCGEIKALDAFVKRTLDPLAYKSWCLPCENLRRKQQYSEQNSYRKAKARANYADNPMRRLETTRRWVKENKEKQAEYLHLWYKSNPEKIKASRIRRMAKVRGAGLGKVTEKEISAIKLMPCFYCGKNDRIEVDHREPIAKGGRHSIGNLVPACMTCNRSKTDKFVMEWRVWKTKRLNNVR